MTLRVTFAQYEAGDFPDRQVVFLSESIPGIQQYALKDGTFKERGNTPEELWQSLNAIDPDIEAAYLATKSTQDCT